MKLLDETRLFNICIDHMTHMALRAISLENHKEKGPVRGPYMFKWYGQKSAYGPTRNVYGPCAASFEQKKRKWNKKVVIW